MKNKTTRFLIASLIGVAVLCVFVFSFLAVFMGWRSLDTITQVGTIYMTGMNERITMHFATTIEYRLSHVENMIPGPVLSGPVLHRRQL